MRFINVLLTYLLTPAGGSLGAEPQRGPEAEPLVRGKG